MEHMRVAQRLECTEAAHCFSLPHDHAPLKYCHYLSIQIRLASFILALSISSQGKAGHSCVPTSALGTKEYIASDILLALSSLSLVEHELIINRTVQREEMLGHWNQPAYLFIYPGLSHLHGIPDIWERNTLEGRHLENFTTWKHNSIIFFYI